MAMVVLIGTNDLSMLLAAEVLLCASGCDACSVKLFSVAWREVMLRHCCQESNHHPELWTPSIRTISTASAC